MHVAFLGYGNVGAALAGRALAAGHAVTLMARADDPARAEAARAANPALAGAAVAPASEAAQAADLVIVALPFDALESALPPLAEALAGTPVVDATNPVGPGLTHRLADGSSGAAHVASLLPESPVVKAFNTYGWEVLADPPVVAGAPAPMLPFATDDAAAAATVSALASSLGWAPLQMGGREAAVDLEHLALLWIRLVRAGGHPGRLAWAALEAA